jgi:hypothetical protein
LNSLTGVMIPAPAPDAGVMDSDAGAGNTAPQIDIKPDAVMPLSLLVGCSCGTLDRCMAAFALVFLVFIKGLGANRRFNGPR